ncbi:hypothetical protein [Nocardia harenae]|uniref:hypothetical protein n=1 Tax=Nocardia harenae TaxID=358707 RepID=UPI000B07AA31|nr:hypothetical protein [Nocardia harenae]
MILFATVVALFPTLLVVGLWGRRRPTPAGRPTVANIQARLAAERRRESGCHRDDTAGLASDSVCRFEPD